MKTIDSVFPQIKIERVAPFWLDACAVAGLLTLGAAIKIPLPFSPVPLTLQTWAVIIASIALPAPRAFAGMALYMALGLAGVPVFAGPAFGPTFGYIAGFAASPYVAKRFQNPIAQIIAITLTIYVLGASWLTAAIHVPLLRAIQAGVLPFMPGDFLKAIAAFYTIRWLKPQAEPQ